MLCNWKNNGLGIRRCGFQILVANSVTLELWEYHSASIKQLVSVKTKCSLYIWDSLSSTAALMIPGFQDGWHILMDVRFYNEQHWLAAEHLSEDMVGVSVLCELPSLRIRGCFFGCLGSIFFYPELKRWFLSWCAFLVFSSSFFPPSTPPHSYLKTPWILTWDEMVMVLGYFGVEPLWYHVVMIIVLLCL